MNLSNLDLLLPTQQPRQPSYMWGTIIQTSPVKVRLDGGEDGIYVTDTLAPTAINDRVLVQLHGTRATIIGVAGGGGLGAYPVGSFYFSSDPTSPQMLFGGVWEQVKGRFLYAADGKHPAGSTGGEETHTLTSAEMPTHGGHFKETGGSKYYLDTQKFSASGTNGRGWTVHWSNEVIPATANAGSGTPHNNMPPFLAAYCWHRIK